MSVIRLGQSSEKIGKYVQVWESHSSCEGHYQDQPRVQRKELQQQLCQKQNFALDFLRSTEPLRMYGR